MLRIVLTDTTGSITATFFNSAWMAKKVFPGDSVLIYGKPERWKPNSPPSFTNPTIEHYEDTNLCLSSPSIRKQQNSVTARRNRRAMKETTSHQKYWIGTGTPPSDSTTRHAPKRSDRYISRQHRKRRKKGQGNVSPFDELFLRIQRFAKTNKQAAERKDMYTNPTQSRTSMNRTRRSG